MFHNQKFRCSLTLDEVGSGAQIINTTPPQNLCIPQLCPSWGCLHFLAPLGDPWQLYFPRITKPNGEEDRVSLPNSIKGVKEGRPVFSGWSFLSRGLCPNPTTVAQAIEWTFRSKAVNLTTCEIGEKWDIWTVITEKGRGFGQLEQKQPLQCGIGVH